MSAGIDLARLLQILFRFTFVWRTLQLNCTTCAHIHVYYAWRLKAIRLFDTVYTFQNKNRKKRVIFLIRLPREIRHFFPSIKSIPITLAVYASLVSNFVALPRQIQCYPIVICYYYYYYYIDYNNSKKNT